MNARPLAPLLFLAWLTCAARAASPAPATAPALSPVLRVLFDQLNADNYKQREDASHQLANLGDVIRPALLDAARPGQPPELRWRATQLLCSLSWAAPDDPPLVRQALTYYASTNPAYRAKAAIQLGVIGEPAFNTLLRLLLEEPDDDVRWVLVQQLRLFTAAPQRAKLQQLNTTADDAPLLAAAGWAWQSKDPARGDALLARCADLAVLSPIDNLQPLSDQLEQKSALELQQIFRWLYQRAVQTGDYNAAARRMRQSILHSDESLPDAMLELFVLHAEHGPLDGFQADVHLSESSFYSPELMYILGRMYARLNQPLLATACYRAAGLSALSDQETHVRLARFLLGRRWHDLAQVECQRILASDGPQKPLYDIEAHYLLAHCAVAQGDDQAAIDSLKNALAVAGQLPGLTAKFESVLHAEIDWHALRLAAAKNDKAQMSASLDEMLKLHPSDDDLARNPDMEIDLINALKTLDRPDDAAQWFNRRFTTYQKQIDAEPFNAEALNNIAWFCARCGERTTQAAQWSLEAIRLAPADAAYLDTAAEAASHVGRWSDAARYEQQALHLQPGDRFMTTQWLRFKSHTNEK